jgi:hypothetical protein
LVYNRFPSRVLFATGADAFVDSGQEVGSLALSGTSVVLADVDGDADRDAFVAYYQAPARLYVNDGSGRFVYSGQQFGDNCFCVAAGDLDSDGDPDLACRLIDDGVLVWMNEDGVYSLSQTLPKGGWGQLLLLDADGDGDLELLVTSNVTGSEIWTNDGAGGLTRSPDALDSATVAACADVDGDGDPDLALDAAVWLNNGAGRFAKAQEFSAQTVTTVALIDLDSDGRPDLLVGGIDLETGNGPLTIYRNRGG